MSTLAEIVKTYVTQELHDYWLERYRDYLEDREPDSYEIWSEGALNTEQLKEAPESVFAAFSFYNENVMQQDWGSVKVYKLEIEEQLLYAVHTITDGDDGWLEVYDEKGNLLGAARRYIELLAWGEVEAIRNTVEHTDFPAELEFRMSATLWGKPQK